MTGTDEELSAALHEAADFLRQYVVFRSGEYADAAALWVAHTYGFQLELWDATMYLAITSPQKNSGKTRLLEVLGALSHRPRQTANISSAALFRVIASERPTLMIDEADAIFSRGEQSESAEALRGTLNAGNRRGGTVTRMAGVGAGMRAVEFDVFGPKAIAGIRRIPETIADRSIEVPMARKLAAEHVEPFRVREALEEAEPIRQRLQAAVERHADELRGYRLDPDDEGTLGLFLSDRQMEGWEPLLAIADATGETDPDRGWMRWARDAAAVVHGEEVRREAQVGETLLLAHILEAFEEADRLPTPALLDALRTRDDGPWAEAFDARWDDDGSKSAAALAERLRPYGVRPRQLRLGVARSRGYRRADFAEAWERWL